MKKLLVGLLFAGAAGGVWSSSAVGLSEDNYANKIEITVSGYSDSAGTLTDFPVLVKLSTAIDGFSYDDFLAGNGGDLRFALEDGTLLSSEVDTWNTAGTSLVWVKVPSFAKDAKIYAYYGATNPDDVNAADVWSADYAGVYHLGESALPLKDSSGVVNNFEEKVGSGITYAATGAIGGSVDFGETNNSRGLKAADHDALDGTSQLTVEIWTYQTSHAQAAIVCKREAYNVDTSWQMYYGNGKTTFGVDPNDGKSPVNMSLIEPGTSVWNHQAYTFDSSLSSGKIKGFLNGTKIGDSGSTACGSVRSGTAPLWLGCFGLDNNGATDARNFPGKIDELRISRVARSADWLKASYDTVTGEGFLTYGAVQAVSTTDPNLDSASIVRNADGTFTVSAVISVCQPAEGAVQCVMAEGVSYEMTTTGTELPLTYTATISDLAANTSYTPAVTLKVSEETTCRKSLDATIYTGAISIAKGADADEKDLTTPGTFVVSRADTTGALVVNYTVSGGTAVADTNYQALSGTVTILEGATSATIDVYPLRANGADSTVEVSLASGYYGLDAAAATAMLTIAKLSTPDGWNTWVAAAAGKASDADNWSNGVPQEGDKILFDGRFSNVNCEWDGGVNGLTDTVSEWAQSSDYTGKVTVDTMFPGAAGATFTCLTVTGDMTVAGGSVIQRAHTAEKKTNTYRLRLTVGGKLTVAAGASISAYGKGSYGTVSPFASSAYGGGYDGANAWGSLTEPYEVGSSPNADGAYTAFAGGDIWIEVAGATELNGTLNADGVTAWGKWNDYAGSGGAIYLKTATLSGTGKMTADCTNSSKRGSNSQTGAGGRVSVLLTAGEMTDFPHANISAVGGIASYDHFGGPGTVLVRTPQKPNGILYLRNRSSNVFNMYGYRPEVSDLTMIPSGQTWTLDGIVFGQFAILRVPTDTTLNLVNGLASVSSTATDRESGILIDGGTLTLPEGDQTISGPWIFQTKNGSITGNLTVTSGGAIGTHFLQVKSASGLRRCNLTVSGDLTIDAGAYVYARRGGYSATGASLPGGTSMSVYGGQNGNSTGLIAYGSIIDPNEGGAFGNDVGRANYGAGAVTLTVGGTLTLNGDMTAIPIVSDSRPGAGGSLNITAARLEGEGSIRADGTMRDYYVSNANGRGASGGGRVSVKLTAADAVISDGWKTRISATGTTPVSAKMTAQDASSAGTVFLRDSTGDRLVVRNDDKAANDVAFTSIPSLTNGGDEDDLSKTALSVEKRAIVKMAGSVRMSGLAMAADTKLDLNGKELTVKRAKVNGARIAPGTYDASSSAVSGYITDSATGGSLVVTGAGLRMIVR